MECDGGGATEEGVCLLPELRLRVLSLLPPNSLALGGRLSSKNAAQHFTELSCRKSHLRQPLPDYAISASLDSAQSALRQLTFRQKLHLPATAAASGCEANVDFALQLLQPHVFSEVLRTDSGYTWAYEGPSSSQLPPTADVGSAAVASGLGHLLPSLEQRCPGLLDPGRTLEAAARHCDLAGLQAAWGLLQQRLRSSLEEEAGCLPTESVQQQQLWQGIMSAAAGSTAPGATSKMEWVLANAPAACDCASILAHACGAVAASGDLARARWIRERGVDWRTRAALRALLQFAELGFVQRLEEEGGYVPAANDVAWRCSSLVNAAAAAPRDSEAKLLWLKHQGASLRWAWEAVNTAAEHGNLAALQLLVQHRGRDAPPEYAIYHAAAAGSMATASWLQQAGCALPTSVFLPAFSRGDLPMVRWLLEVGCPRRAFQTIATAICKWPRNSTADGERLVEAVRLLAAAGWPIGEKDEQELASRAASAGHLWAVCCGLLQLRGLHPVTVPHAVAKHAAAAGCLATLEAVHGKKCWGDDVYKGWYADAAKNGDQGTLAWLRRQRLPWGYEVISEAAIKGAPFPALLWMVKQGAPLMSTEIERIQDILGCSSSRRWQPGVEAWLLVCSRWWAIRLRLATVWLACVVLVAAAVVERMHGGQYGLWALAAVHVFVWAVWLVAACLWATACGEAPTCRSSPQFLAL